MHTYIQYTPAYICAYMHGEKPGSKHATHLEVNTGWEPWKKEGKARDHTAQTADPTSRRPISVPVSSIRYRI